MSNPTASSDLERSEHDSTYGVKKIRQYVYDGSNLIGKTADDVAIRLDDTSTANVTYVGKATVGSSTASAVWQIKKIDETTGLVITWADGDTSFNNVWDNRVSLSYS